MNVITPIIDNEEMAPDLSASNILNSETLNIQWPVCDSTDEDKEGCC